MLVLHGWFDKQLIFNYFKYAFFNSFCIFHFGSKTIFLSSPPLFSFLFNFPFIFHLIFFSGLTHSNIHVDPWELDPHGHETHTRTHERARRNGRARAQATRAARGVCPLSLSLSSVLGNGRRQTDDRGQIGGSCDICGATLTSLYFCRVTLARITYRSHRGHTWRKRWFTYLSMVIWGEIGVMKGCLKRPTQQVLRHFLSWECRSSRDGDRCKRD